MLHESDYVFTFPFQLRDEVCIRRRVLQEDERKRTLRAELHEVGSLQRFLLACRAVVRDHPHKMSERAHKAVRRDALTQTDTHP